MQKPQSYRDLIVWQRAVDLIDEIDAIIERLTPLQRFWLGGQIYRAALSISSNIAEGHDHDYSAVYLRRLADAKGSTREVESQLLVIQRRKNMAPNETKTALAMTDEIGRMLRSLTRRVRARAQSESIPNT
jgi:four helix bundle protein